MGLPEGGGCLVQLNLKGEMNGRGGGEEGREGERRGGRVGRGEEGREGGRRRGGRMEGREGGRVEGRKEGRKGGREGEGRRGDGEWWGWNKEGRDVGHLYARRILLTWAVRVSVFSASSSRLFRTDIS